MLMAKMNIPTSERPQVKAECLRLLTTLRLDPARMQLISGFVDVYLDLNTAENELFNATIDRMGLTEQEEYMEIVTSWKREGIQEGRLETQEEIAKNLLREDMTVEVIVKVTGLTIERVQELRSHLQNNA
jgi:predicted transposase/invertase (TIGR01784 family)